MDVLQEIGASLRIGDDNRVGQLTQQAIDDGLSAEEIGADGYGYDAANAVEQVKTLTGV